MQNKRLILRQHIIRFLCSLLLLHVFCASAFAAPVRLQQMLSWKADRNALSYRVEIQPIGGKSQFIETEANSVQVSLSAGSYRYRVYAYDVLGRESTVSEWTAFEVLQANQPKITPPADKVALSEDGSTLELDVPVANVTNDSRVELINTQTGAVLSGTLSVTRPASTASETAEATKAQFTNVPEGNWKLRVTNPSGLTSETKAFAVTDEAKARRIAEEEARKAEEARIAAEKAAAEEEARKAEEARVGAEAAAENAAAEEEARKAEDARIGAEAAAEAAAENAAAEKDARNAEEALASAENAVENAPVEEEAQSGDEELAASDEEPAVEDESGDSHKKAKSAFCAQIVGGGGFASSVAGDGLSEYSDANMALMPNLRIAFLPASLSEKQLFGIEFDVKFADFTQKTDYYDTRLSLGAFQANVLFQQLLLGKSLFVAVRAGGGVTVLSKEVEYTYSGTKRESPDLQTFVYPMVQAGASIVWLPLKYLAVEAGADFDHVLNVDMPLFLVCPYLCVGLRL